MKKYLFAAISVLVIAASFSSCKPDEEIYNPKCRISKIWYKSEVGDPAETFVYAKNGKTLNQIVCANGESYDFSYNKDKSVSQIVHKGSDYTEEIKLESTNRLVDRMSYFIDGVLRMEMIVTHDDDTRRITTIEETYDREFFEAYLKSRPHPLYDRFVGNYDEVLRIVEENPTRDLVFHSRKTFTYDPGKKKEYNNISTYVEEFPSAQTVVTHTITYDPESFNPFYGLPFVYADYAGYYVNNKLSEHIETVVAGNMSRVENIVYSYDGVNYMNNKNYPRQFVTTSDRNNVPEHTYILYKK
ncbi:MAG: hypothetical protein SPL47_09000 [Bacteroidales bacterium]|nr:hypothetical protein [Bacteroidales bacterium]